MLAWGQFTLNDCYINMITTHLRYEYLFEDLLDVEVRMHCELNNVFSCSGILNKRVILIDTRR